MVLSILGYRWHINKPVDIYISVKGVKMLPISKVIPYIIFVTFVILGLGIITIQNDSHITISLTLCSLWVVLAKFSLNCLVIDRLSWKRNPEAIQNLKNFKYNEAAATSVFWILISGVIIYGLLKPVGEIDIDFMEVAVAWGLIPILSSWRTVDTLAKFPKVVSFSTSSGEKQVRKIKNYIFTLDYSDTPMLTVTDLKGNEYQYLLSNNSLGQEPVPYAVYIQDKLLIAEILI